MRNDPRGNNKLWQLKQLRREIERFFGKLWFCKRGRHQPSRRRTKWTYGFWVSQCRYCGEPMQRLRKHVWVLKQDV